MTICGFAKTRSGIGFSWADSESYIYGRPIPEETPKLAVSTGNIVGMGVGYRTLTESFRLLLIELGRASFSCALSRMPALLRHELAVDDAYRKTPRETLTTLAVCGMDGGQFKGAVFAERNRFEPVLRDAWTAPHISQSVETAADVLQIAQCQIGIIRKDIAADATGGQLTIAKIGPEKVVTTRVPLLLAHEGGRAAGFPAAGRWLCLRRVNGAALSST
jgi:hypothetical protein